MRPVEGTPLETEVENPSPNHVEKQIYERVLKNSKPFWLTKMLVSPIRLTLFIIVLICIYGLATFMVIYDKLADLGDINAEEYFDHKDSRT